MRLEFCVACGSKEDLQHHHLVMRSEGGSDDKTNLITLCTACHHKAHSRQMNGRYSHSELVRAGRIRALTRYKDETKELERVVEAKLRRGINYRKIARQHKISNADVLHIRREVDARIADPFKDIRSKDFWH
jgi:cytochrome c553